MTRTARNIDFRKLINGVYAPPTTRKEHDMTESHIDRFISEACRALNDRDWDAYGKLFAEELVMRTPSIPGVATGRAARVEFVQDIFAAFPDGKISTVSTLADGDWGCTEVHFVGTNTGPMEGADGADIAPTDKPVEFDYCIVAKFSDGVITELHEYYDQLGMLTQLGIAA